MRLNDGGNVPDHIRRAIRLSLAVLLLSALGFSLVGIPGHGPIVMLVKWAALTCPVVTMPLLGKTSQVSFERALGTVVGGALGFLATALATRWWTLHATETDDIFLATVAAAASFLSVLVGQRLGLDLSAKLFVIAFLLVCFSSQEGRDPLVTAATRVGGICTGVGTMLLMSIFVLPKSATIEALRTLSKALDKLAEVNRIAWGPYLPAEHTAARLVALSTPPGARDERQAAPRPLGGDSAVAEPLLPPGGDLEVGPRSAFASAPRRVPTLDLSESSMSPEEAEAHMLQCEKVVTELYSVLTQLNEQLALAKTETWVSSCGGRPFLLPGLPFWQSHSTHLPWRELDEMAVAVRRVARLLNTAIFTFEVGFEQQMREALGPSFPNALLPTLAAACHAAIKEICDAFPCRQHVGTAGLAAYGAAVRSLTEMNEQQRQRLAGTFKRHRSRGGARSSWAHIIDVVLEEQRSQLVGSLKGGSDGQAEPSTPTAASPRLADTGSGRAVPAAAPEQAQREASLAGWLRRLGSARSGSIDSVAAAAIEAVAAAEASRPGSAASGGPTAGATRVSPVKSASLAAVASQRRGLAPLAEDGAAQNQAALQLLSRASMLRGISAASNNSTTVPLTLFPDTTQGRLAQVSFFSFMFMCEEMREQLEQLNATVEEVLCRLPA